MHGAEVLVRAGGAEGEFMQAHLAGQDDAGLLEPGDDKRVLGGDAVAEEAGATGRGDAGRVEEVLGSEGDAVERTAVAAGLQFGVGGGRPLAGEASGNGDVGVQLRLGHLDACEHGLGQGHGGEAAVAKGIGSFADGEVVRVFH